MPFVDFRVNRSRQYSPPFAKSGFNPFMSQCIMSITVDYTTPKKPRDRAKKSRNKSVRSDDTHGTESYSVVFPFLYLFISIICGYSYKTWWSRHSSFFLNRGDKSGICGRTGYPGSTGRTGHSPDPSDPTAYCTHTSLAHR